MNVTFAPVFAARRGKGPRGRRDLRRARLEAERLRRQLLKKETPPRHFGAEDRRSVR